MSYTPPPANAADFQFGGPYTPPPSNAADFSFGSVQLVELALAGALPGPTFSAVAIDPSYVEQVSLTGTLPGVTVSAAVERGATVNLLFLQEASSSTDLVFGGETSVGPGLVGIQVAGELPGLNVWIEAKVAQPVMLTGQMPGMTMDASAAYSSNTARPTVASRSSAHQVAASAPAGPQMRQQSASASPAGWGAFWQRATGLQPGVEHRLPDVLKPSPVQAGARHQDASRTRTGADVVSQEADRSVRRLLASAFEAAAAARSASSFRHQDGDRTKRTGRSTKWTEAQPSRRSYGSSFQPAAPYLRGLNARHQDGVPPPAGLSLRPLPPSPPNGCYTPSGHLVFSFPPALGGHLVFQCGDYVPEPGGTVIVPVRKVYIVINSAALYRVPDGTPIPTLGLSLSLDASSWTWGFDAQLPLEAQALVEPAGGPVELRAVINGTEFRLLAENMSRERSFGRASLRVSGRGRNAILDAPYAPVTSYGNVGARTAAQIAGDILTYNGVSIGWAVDWGLTDWLVPAGVFSHQGTHISALNAVARAAGGYLQPHRTDPTLRVLPLYPSAPWAWGSVTPDFELPADVTVRESLQWADKPDYNRVYVVGQQAGVQGRVTRAGTAGDLLAQMVVDPLITHADAARQRGIAVLADTGRIATVGLSLPILPETGIIEPGKFVRYVDGAATRLGIVRSTSVSVGASAVDTRQQIVLETHE